MGETTCEKSPTGHCVAYCWAPGRFAVPALQKRAQRPAFLTSIEGLGGGADSGPVGKLLGYECLRSGLGQDLAELAVDVDVSADRLKAILAIIQSLHS